MEMIMREWWKEKVTRNIVKSLKKEKKKSE